MDPKMSWTKNLQTIYGSLNQLHDMSCPVCAVYVGSGARLQQHVEHCLESSSHYTCPLCSIDLTAFDVGVRVLHVENCDHVTVPTLAGDDDNDDDDDLVFVKPRKKPRRAVVPPCSPGRASVPDWRRVLQVASADMQLNLQAFDPPSVDTHVTAPQFECVLCGAALHAASVSERTRHLRQCAQTVQNVDMHSLAEVSGILPARQRTALVPSPRRVSRCPRMKAHRPFRDSRIRPVRHLCRTIRDSAAAPLIASSFWRAPGATCITYMQFMNQARITRCLTPTLVPQSAAINHASRWHLARLPPGADEVPAPAEADAAPVGTDSWGHWSTQDNRLEPQDIQVDLSLSQLGH
jgi:hypothetical protein